MNDRYGRSSGVKSETLSQNYRCTVGVASHTLSRHSSFGIIVYLSVRFRGVGVTVGRESSINTVAHNYFDVVLGDPYYNSIFRSPGVT